MAAGFQEKIILKLVEGQLLHLIRLKLFVQLKREMMRQFERLGLTPLSGSKESEVMSCGLM